ncbi:MAG: phosphoribosylaminoimidazolesuccinocarboxamide synthase [Deltaproteobacteria bacterium]|nr:phosphoribosylaminoimidazolesuccinocarboxamide synthase [Deltaproteobacteria bacterium]
MSDQAVIQTQLQKYKKTYQGKVRDLYDLGNKMLLVATDRLSAFDYILKNPIPTKGKILTQLSVFWFKQTQNLISNHLLSTDISPYVANENEKNMLEGRTMVVKKLKRLDVEAIVRGYLTGSAWVAYQETGKVNGIKLPAALRDGDPLPEPLFTPSTKAEVGTHDEPLTFDETVNLIGGDWAEKMREAALKIFKQASGQADKNGLLIADTKMEFGISDFGQLTLIDELLTPDSSRFWLKEEYVPGRSPNPWDKQLVRNYLLSTTWDRNSPPPELPGEIINETLFRYQSIAERLMK